MSFPFNNETPLYEQVAGEQLFDAEDYARSRRGVVPPAAEPPIEDWSEGGDLDTSIPDPTPPEVTDPEDPDYVAPWWPL